MHMKCCHPFNNRCGRDARQGGMVEGERSTTEGGKMINVPLHRLLLSDSDLLSLVSFVRGGRVGLLLQHSHQGSREDFVSLIPLEVRYRARTWMDWLEYTTFPLHKLVWDIAPCSLLYGRLSSSGQSGRMVTRRQGPKEPSEAGRGARLRLLRQATVKCRT